MASSDEQLIEILRNIWNEMKALKASLESQLTTTREDLGSRIDQTNERLDQTNERLDQTNERLEDLGRRVTESEMRLATATTELAGDVHVLSDLIREWRGDRRADRSRLEKRVTRIEEHVGLVAVEG